MYSGARYEALWASCCQIGFYDQSSHVRCDERTLLILSPSVKVQDKANCDLLFVKRCGCQVQTMPMVYAWSLRTFTYTGMPAWTVEPHLVWVMIVVNVDPIARNIPFCWDIVIPSQQRWRGYSNAAVRGWLGEWVSEWVGLWVCAWVRPALPCGHDSHHSFCPINFKLHMQVVDD